MQKQTRTFALVGLLVILASILAITLVELLQEINSLNAQGIFTPAYHPRDLLRRSYAHVPLAATPPPAIQTHPLRMWMTFNYINAVYHLPADYLKTGLHIALPQYPRLSIRRYANLSHADVSFVIKEIETHIQNFQATSTPIR